MRQAHINVRTRACSRTSIARTKQAALTHNVRGKELRESASLLCVQWFVLAWATDYCSWPYCVHSECAR